MNASDRRIVEHDAYYYGRATKVALFSMVHAKTKDTAEHYAQDAIRYAKLAAHAGRLFLETRPS